MYSLLVCRHRPLTSAVYYARCLKSLRMFLHSLQVPTAFRHRPCRFLTGRKLLVVVMVVIVRVGTSTSRSRSWALPDLEEISFISVPGVTFCFTLAAEPQCDMSAEEEDQSPNRKNSSSHILHNFVLMTLTPSYRDIPSSHLNLPWKSRPRMCILS